MFDKKNSKKIITGLLVLSCAVSGIILAASSPYKAYRLENTQQLDSLISLQIEESRIKDEQLSVRRIKVDTIFTRKEYRIEVPTYFSKTLFHIDLHKSLNRFDIDAPAKVQLPSRDMDIYVYKNGTVLRNILLTTNPELDSIMTDQN